MYFLQIKQYLLVEQGIYYVYHFRINEVRKIIECVVIHLNDVNESV